MEGFKKLPKMQCFKTGGAVNKKEYCEGGKAYKAGGAICEKDDIAQDKKIVKKAIAMHDKQEHEGEKTDLSKLRKGGRAKKEKGTVKKFKEGGKTGAAKSMGDGKRAPSAAVKKAPKKAKPSGDADLIMAAPAPTAPEMAAAPSAAMMEQPPMFAEGGSLRGLAQNSDGLGRAAMNIQPQPGMSEGLYSSGGDIHHHYYGGVNNPV